MFSRILVGVDGSDRGASALAVATELAVAERGRLALMATVPHPSPWAWGGPISLEDLRRDSERDSETELRKAAEAVPAQVSTTVLVRHGPAVARLLDEVRRDDYDLIVVGSRHLVACAQHSLAASGTGSSAKAPSPSWWYPCRRQTCGAASDGADETWPPARQSSPRSQERRCMSPTFGSQLVPRVAVESRRRRQAAALRGGHNHASRRRPAQRSHSVVPTWLRALPNFYRSARSRQIRTTTADCTLTEEQRSLRAMAHDFAAQKIRAVAWNTTATARGRKRSSRRLGRWGCAVSRVGHHSCPSRSSSALAPAAAQRHRPPAAPRPPTPAGRHDHDHPSSLPDPAERPLLHRFEDLGRLLLDASVAIGSSRRAIEFHRMAALQRTPRFPWLAAESRS